jgi:hypothetical protein
VMLADLGHVQRAEDRDQVAFDHRAVLGERHLPRAGVAVDPVPGPAGEAPASGV